MRLVSRASLSAALLLLATALLPLPLGAATLSSNTAALTTAAKSSVAATATKSALSASGATVNAPLAVAQSATGAIPNVEAFDAAARQLQLRLESLLADPRADAHSLAAAEADHRAAEEDLDAARDAAWDSLSAPRANATLIGAPLVLAMLDLHVELRRALGADFHTRVPGLEGDWGCRGDVVGDRLVYAYGAAVTAPLGAGDLETQRALDGLARQIACLGSGQLAALERGLSRGYLRVRTRMRRRGLQALEPGFVRVLAPVQLLVLDARKHRGLASRAWSWFRDQREELRDAVAAAGWATDELLVWDRRHAFLLGLPACAPGTSAADCVELATFLDSLDDPRALGLGGCGFAGMVSRGVESLDGDLRYACPIVECAAPAQGAGPAKPGGVGELAGSAQLASGSSGVAALGGGPSLGTRTSSTFGGPGGPADPRTAQLEEIWGGELGIGDLASMQGICAGAGQDLQGPNFDVSSCLEELPASSAHDPFAAHMACMAEALGIGEDPAIGELPGVPNGPECGLLDGEEGGAPDPKSEKPKPSDPPTATPNPTAQQLEEGTTSEIKTEGGSILIRELQDAETGEVVRVSVTIQGNVENASQVVQDEVYTEPSIMHEYQLSALGDALEVAVYEAEQEAKSQADCKNGCSGSAEVPRYPGSPGQGGDCFDGFGCSDSCTGVGEQVAAASDCNATLFDDLAEAAGLGRPDPTNPPDITSNWDPSSDHGIEEDDTFACLGGGVPARPPAHCGLVLCADGPAVGVGDECGCPGVPPLAVEEVCIEARCADGQVPGPNCECGGVGGYGGPPPVPEPGPEISLGVALGGGTSPVALGAGGKETLSTGGATSKTGGPPDLGL